MKKTTTLTNHHFFFFFNSKKRLKAIELELLLIQLEAILNRFVTEISAADLMDFYQFFCCSAIKQKQRVT